MDWVIVVYAYAVLDGSCLNESQVQSQQAPYCPCVLCCPFLHLSRPDIPTQILYAARYFPNVFIEACSRYRIVRSDRHC